jgi:hypothetical protein
MLITSKYDVFVYLKDAATIGLRYRPTLMSKETATDMAAALHRSCTDILNPQTLYLGDVQVVGVEQLQKIQKWNMRSPTEAHQLVHQTFETQVSGRNSLATCRRVY